MEEKYYISSNKYTVQERITAKRGKVYDIVFRIVTFDGVEKQKKISGFQTKSLAKEGYLTFVNEHCQLIKNNPIKIKRQSTQKSSLIVGDLIKEHIFSLQNVNKESSIFDKNNIYTLYVLPYYENTKIEDLTVQELSKWQEKLWTTVNPKTNAFFSYQYLKKIKSVFSSFLSWVELRYGFLNNMKRVPTPKRRQPKKEMQFWTREEFNQFISVVDDPLYHCLFTMLFFTGRRKSEILALSPTDVHTDYIVFNKTLSTRTMDDSLYKITSTKNERNGKTYISKPLQQELSTFTPQSPFFFGGQKPIPVSSLTRKFISYTSKAKVKPIRIHDLRHSFVSMLIHLGANTLLVADLIGDTPEQVNKTYAHLYQEDKISILSKLL